MLSCTKNTRQGKQMLITTVNSFNESNSRLIFQTRFLLASGPCTKLRYTSRPASRIHAPTQQHCSRSAAVCAEISERRFTMIKGKQFPRMTTEQDTSDSFSLAHGTVIAKNAGRCHAIKHINRHFVDVRAHRRFWPFISPQNGTNRRPHIPLIPTSFVHLVPAQSARSSPFVDSVWKIWTAGKCACCVLRS